MTASARQPAPTVLEYPFRGRWRVENSPARRVPSHGTTAFGSAYAIDFVAVDEQGLSAPSSWRRWLASEPPERFLGFGRPILAPVTGTVVEVLDGVPDHVGRRSQLSLIPYMLGQARRARDGAAGLAGNHVVLALADAGPYVLVAHLRCGSVRVGIGDLLTAGDPLGECGNSGNSTEPHVHVQASDSLDWPTASGLPIAFGNPDGSSGLPGERDIVIA